MNEFQLVVCDSASLKVSNVVAQIYQHAQFSGMDKRIEQFKTLCLKNLNAILPLSLGVWFVCCADESSDEKVAKDVEICMYGDTLTDTRLFDQLSVQELLELSCTTKDDAPYSIIPDTLTIDMPHELCQMLVLKFKDSIDKTTQILLLFRPQHQGFKLDEIELLTFVFSHIVRAYEINKGLIRQFSLVQHNDLTVNLTLTEQKVATLMKRGLSTKVTAAVLGSAARTVEKHQASIYEKLNTNNRAETVGLLGMIG